MKEYKLVYLNKELKWSQEEDFEQAEAKINEWVNDGWELVQVFCPSGLMGTLVGLFSRDKQ